MAYPEDVQESRLSVPAPRPMGVEADLTPDAAGLYGRYFGQGMAAGPMLSLPNMQDYVWWEPLRLPDRFGSQYRETLSDILRGVRQSDVSASERLTPTSRVELGQEVDYSTILRPLDPIAQLRASRELDAPAYEQAVVYETARELLQRTYPPGILVTTQTAMGVAEAPAHEIVEYVFERWKQLYPWFDYEPVPPLYWFIKDENGDYTITPNRSVIQLRQNEDGTTSMATFIDRLLKTFQGYGFRLNRNGRFQILPAPWAASALMENTLPAIQPAYITAGTPMAIPLPSGHVDGSSGMPLLVTTGEDLAVTVTARPYYVNENGAVIPGPPGAAVTLPLTKELSAGEPIYDGREIIGGPQHYSFQAEYSITSRYVAVLFGRLRVEYDLDSGQLLATVTRADDEYPTALVDGQYADFEPLGWLFTLEARTLPPWGIRAVELTQDHIKDRLPTGTLDLSRVINLQRAVSESMTYVDEQSLLTGVYTKHDAGFESDFAPGGKILIPRGTRHLIDDGGQPVLVGSGPLNIAFRYTLRRHSSSGGPHTGDDAGLEVTGNFDLAAGETRTVQINYNGIPDMMFGVGCYITFTREGSEANTRITVSINGIDRSPNVAARRPFFAHFVEYDIQGPVWAPSGEEIEAAYGAGVLLDPDDSQTELSAASFGVREGSKLQVEFFEADYDMLLNICRSIVSYARVARRRWDNVALTAASSITPEDFNKVAVLPGNVAAVIDTYDYADDRSYRGVMASRSIALEELYSLAVDTGGPAVDTLTNPTDNAVAIHGLSYLL